MDFFRDGGNSVPVVSKVLSRELVAMACRMKAFFLFALSGAGTTLVALLSLMTSSRSVTGRGCCRSLRSLFRCFARWNQPLCGAVWSLRSRTVWV